MGVCVGSLGAGCTSSLAYTECHLSPPAPATPNHLTHALPLCCLPPLHIPRPGRFKEARQLARQVGQPYRAGIMAGGGPFGPLPVGAAAAVQDEELSEQQVKDELALEVGVCVIDAGRVAKLLCWGGGHGFGEGQDEVANWLAPELGALGAGEDTAGESAPALACA